MAKAPQQKDDKKEITQEHKNRINEHDDEEDKEQQNNPLYGLSFGNAIKKITTDSNKQKSKE